VAEAGLAQYAAADAVRLDGAGSYDPDGSGPLTFAWRQLSGPSVVITDANSSTPLISGPVRKDGRGRTTFGPFVQTDAIQECEFELVVSDGELTSAPDTVKVIIVPDFGAVTLQQQNAPFDPNKPTVFYFSGGDCVNGFTNEQPWGNAAWFEKANIINFPQGYAPDTSSAESWPTYYHMGDMIIVFLSKVAPHYDQPIQTIGWSTGGQPALDAGIRLNRVYRDRRYAVNHVTELDAPCRWQLQGIDVYTSSNTLFRTSAVDEEQCWHDHYWGASYPMGADEPRNVLGVSLDGYDHPGVRDWYRNSLTIDSANQFNHGAIAGAFWSVAGAGRNLQLASTPDTQIYKLRWVGSGTNGQMEFYDESNHPGRLPEPVILGAWANKSKGSGDIDGAVLTCDECENAVGYQLLVGSDPHRVMDFNVVSDTPTPPTEVLRDFPSEETWWTVRVRDQYGSTIYADPIRLDLTNLPPMPVENARTGKRYGFVGHAIRDAESGDNIVLERGTYEENIEFDGKSLTVRSLDPNDPEVVASTIIRGRSGSPAATFSGPESRGCTLTGLTIQSGTVGVSCRDAAPTIRNCVVDCPNSVAVEFWWGREPTLIACTIVGQITGGGDPGLVAYWRLDEPEGQIAHEVVGHKDGTLHGGDWEPAAGRVGGALRLDGTDDYVDTGYALDPSSGPFSVFAWVKGGGAGQVILSQKDGANWLMASSPAGLLMTDLKSGGRYPKSLTSTAAITGGDWHRVGLSWDGSNRVLYVDDMEAAKDTQPSLPSSTGDLIIGAGSTLAAGTFWSGLIDDVRIYNRAVKP
jgi:hypothetical protein